MNKSYELITRGSDGDFLRYLRNRIKPCCDNGLPLGGKTGQVIKKNSDDDLDYSWADDEGEDTVYVNTYTDLPDPTTVTNTTYGVLTSTGVPYISVLLGGNYRAKGFYRSNGTDWIYLGEFPIQATNSEVQTGTVTDKFVSPATLRGNYFYKGGNSFGTNASIGTNDNFTFILRSNNQDRAYLFADGNFSIGNPTNRNFKLDVLGTSMFQGDHTIKVAGSYDVVTSYNAGSNSVTYTVNGTGRHFQISSPTNFYLVTSGTRRMTTLASGNTIFGTSITDTGELVNVDGSFRASRVSVGGSGLLSSRIAISGQLAGNGSTSAYGLYQYGVTSSDVTLNSVGIRSQTGLGTNAVVTNLINFWATKIADGTGASSSTSIGYWADNTIGGFSSGVAYGFLGSLNSGSGKWNLYMQGTAPNYLAGVLHLGLASGDRRFNFYNNLQLTGNTVTYANYTNGQIQSDSATAANGYASQLGIVAGGSVSSLSHFTALQGGFGAGSTVSQQTAYDTNDLTGGVINIAFRGRLSAGINKWNLYMEGSAANFLNGSTTFTKGIIVTYTPTGSTDSTLPNGSMCADDSFLYRRDSSGTWKKNSLDNFLIKNI